MAYRARHEIQVDPTIEWCRRCGRHTKPSGRRHAHMKVWREPCRATTQVSHARRCGHEPTFEGGRARCGTCGATTKGGEMACVGQHHAQVDGGLALASDYGHEAGRVGQRLTCRVCLLSVNGAGVSPAVQSLWARGCSQARGHRAGARRGHACTWTEAGWQCVRCQADWTMAAPCAGSSKHKRGAAQHVITEADGHRVCHGCGHHTSAASTRNAQNRVWGRPCVPTRHFDRAGRYGHEPAWAAGAWACSLCQKPARAWDGTCPLRREPNTRIRGKQQDPHAAARRVRARTRGPEDGAEEDRPEERGPGGAQRH